MRDVVGPRDIPMGLSGLAPAQRFLDWCGIIFGGRPIFTARAIARLRPSPVLVRISSRSNSARPPRTARTASMSRPWALDVTLAAPVQRATPLSATSAIEVKLAGAVVRVASGMDDAAQLTAVLRAVRASASGTCLATIIA